MPSAAKPAPAVVDKDVFLYFSADVAELLSFAVESRFHARITPHATVAGAVLCLKTGSFDLAVLDMTRPDWMLVFEQVQTQKIPFVLHHPEAVSPEVRGPKIKTYKENELVEAVRAALVLAQATPKEGGGTDPSAPYIGMGVSLLQKTNPQPVDLYIRLSALKFVKLHLSGSEFSAEDEAKCKTKKIDRLFFHEKSVEKVVGRVNGLLEGLLKSNKPKSEVAPTQVESIEVMQELVKQVGFTPEVQKLVKNNMNLVVKEMQDSPSLSGILKNMERNKDKYNAAHSQMLAEVSCALAIAMEWGSDMSLKKIAMASLLHDMCINDQRLCAVKDMKDLQARKAEFDLSKQEEYTNHTKKAAILIQGMKEVPADVDKIVYQHHELPRGTGFPEAIGHTHIHPLAATLMVSHDLVDWLIEHPGPPDMPAFMTAYDEKYQQGVFKKIMKSLKDLKLS